MNSYKQEADPKCAPLCATCKDVSRMLQISENTVRAFAMRDNDPLPRFTYPGQTTWRYDIEQVKAWYERNMRCA